MADIFLSYSRLDRERVRVIAERLQSLGHSVFWERTSASQAGLDQVERELDECRAALVVWSHNARSATHVLGESAKALDAEKLVQLRIDTVDAPAPFNALPLADMGTDRAEWGQLEDRVQRLVRGEPLTKSAPRLSRPGLFAVAPAAGAPRLVMIALGAVLAAFAGAQIALHNNAMTPDQMQIAMTGILGVAGACAALCLQRLAAITRAGG